MPNKPITASQVRFIKLGRKGLWEEECIEGPQPCIRLGFRSKQHRKSLAGDWDSVFHYWSTQRGKTKGKATETTNLIRTFYTADERALWITFYQRKLWWCFASRVIEELPDKTRIRRTLRPWSCRDRLGRVLHVDGLSGALTKVQGYRGTICTVDQEAYLLNRLNGELPPEVKRALKCVEQLELALQPLIQKVGWKDFELLCDLIFTQGGWQRISSLGKTEKTIDMVLLAPVTGKRAMVQVKSRADLATFRRYRDQFKKMSGYDEMYFVVHTPTEELAAYKSESRVILLTAQRLAKLVVSSGLAQWLIQKAS
jgi:hypothetical protein